MKHHRYVALLGALVGLAACGGDEEPVTPPPSLRVATYNAGLAVGFVTAAKERAPLTSQAIAGLGANLVCVQEYWRKDHVAALQQATAASLPQTFFPDPMPDDNPGEAACTHEELAELDACVKAKCDVCVDELVKCVLKNCGAEFSAVPEGCSGCLQANVGQELDDIVQSCTSGSVAYAYGGAFGTGILTGATIKAKDQTVFASHTNRRAVLHVELETAPLGTVHAFCTHLTAVFADIPFPEEQGSWEEEQAQQIDELLAYVDEKAGTTPAIIMGDMNTGPAGASFVGEVPANYAKFVKAGLHSPYVERAAAQCTFCQTNPLVAGAADDSQSVVIDHVLLRSFAGVAMAERVLDQPIQVETCGKPIAAAYSDHYGVMVSLSWPSE